MAASPPAGHPGDASLVAWIRANGGFVHSSIAVPGPTAYGGRGIIAQRPIEAGERLLDVPTAICLHLPAKADGDATQVRRVMGCAFFELHSHGRCVEMLSWTACPCGDRVARLRTRP